jgi:deoxyribonuclease-1
LLRGRVLKHWLGAAILGGLLTINNFQPLDIMSFDDRQPLGENGRPAGALWAAEPVIPDSYAVVKRELFEDVFADHRQTLYCGCAFDRAKRPDLTACGYQSRGDAMRARRVEVEHVVPASWLGRGHRCWSEPLCRSASGRPYKGRQCCLAIDPAFTRAHNDLHNLWPALGEVNEQRGNEPFGIVAGEPRAFGRCDFEVDRAAGRVEPRPEVRGDIARIQLYMAETYGIALSPDQRTLLEAWDRADPPDDFERTRDARIKRLQGHGNRFVDGRRPVTQLME